MFCFQHWTRLIVSNGKHFRLQRLMIISCAMFRAKVISVTALLNLTKQNHNSKLPTVTTTARIQFHSKTISNKRQPMKCLLAVIVSGYCTKIFSDTEKNQRTIYFDGKIMKQFYFVGQLLEMILFFFVYQWNRLVPIFIWGINIIIFRGRLFQSTSNTEPYRKWALLTKWKQQQQQRFF